MQKKKRDTFLTCFLILLIINAVVVVIISPYLTFTPNNYRAYNYNLVWDECGIQIRKSIFPGETHYKIKEVPIREFVACRRYQGGIGAGHDPILMVRKGFEPQITLDVTSAELYLGTDPWYFSEEEWRSLASSIKKLGVTKLGEDIARELAQQIMSDSTAYIERNDLSEISMPISNDEHYMLMLQFESEEYDNILWLAKIVHSGDAYYIEIITAGRIKQYLPCSEELSQLIDEIVIEYGLTSPANG